MFVVGVLVDSKMPAHGSCFSPSGFLGFPFQACRNSCRFGTSVGSRGGRSGC